MKASQMNINVSFNILPFGHAVIRIKGREETEEEKIVQLPIYTEPKTTNPQIIEIRLEGQDYIVPKTTGGLL